MAKNRIRHHVNPLSDRSDYSFAGFPDDKPIIVDIGADRGEFTAGLLEKFGSEYNFIVLEIRKPLALKLEQKFAQYENVVVFAGDAVRNMRSLLLPSITRGVVIDAIYINFPDPWFKDRHHKRRVICQRLIDDVREWIPSRTKWIYQTDQQQLFDDTVSLLKENQIDHIEYFDNPPYGIVTKWEQAQAKKVDHICRMKFVF